MSIVSVNLKILFASSNQGKLREVRAVAERFGVGVLSPPDLAPDWPRVKEDADTYRANAFLKAEAFFAWSKLPSLADDSGLEVSCLSGAPGVLSARFAGEKATDAQNRAKLLERLRGQTQRQALFRCQLCLKCSPAQLFFAEGILEGEIANAERGGAGFGYDSLFVVSGTGKTLAELKGAQVEPQTHRVRALENLFAQSDLTSCLKQSN